MDFHGGILFYDEPSRTDASTWSIQQSGTVAQFETDPDDLIAGRPADQTSILWTFEGSRAITDYVAICRDWVIARAIRGVEVRGVSLKAGTVVTVTGRRASDPVGTYPYALGGNSAAVNVVQFDDGSNGIIIVCASGLTPIVGIMLKVFNNDGTNTVYLNNGDFIYIGSFTCYQGWEPPDGVSFNWQWGLGGLPTDDETGNNQNRPIPNGQFYRTLSIELEDQHHDGVFGDPAAPTAMTYNKLIKFMISNLVGFVIRYLDDAGAIDSFTIQKLSIFGTCTPSTPKPQGGNYYTMDLAFKECAAFTE